MTNPDLISATATTSSSVPQPTKFKHRNEFGDVVESTKPMDATPAPMTKGYTSPHATTSFIRPDGKKLPFINGYFETNLYWDQWFLDQEIAEGNPYISAATDGEVKAAHMRIDPRGTIKNELLNDPDLRAELEDKIRAEMAMDLKKTQGVDSGIKETIKGDGVSLNLLKPTSTTDLSGILGASNSAKS